MGIPEMFIDTGSTINLTCIVSQSPNPPANILWTHNGEVIEIKRLLWLPLENWNSFIMQYLSNFKLRLRTIFLFFFLPSSHSTFVATGDKLRFTSRRSQCDYGKRRRHHIISFNSKSQIERQRKIYLFTIQRHSR